MSYIFARSCRGLTAIALSILACGILPKNQALGQTHWVDQISNQYFAQFINDQRQTAGYSLTTGHSEPYQVAAYSPGGSIQTFGMQSPILDLLVMGIDRHGNIVGNLAPPNSSAFQPYRIGNGVPEFLPLDPEVFPAIFGTSSSGTAYGVYSVLSPEGQRVFTYDGGALVDLPVSYPFAYALNSRLLNDRGLAGLAYVDETFDFIPFLYDMTTGTESLLEIPDGYDAVELRQITNSDLIYGLTRTSDGNDFRYGLWNLDGSFGHYFGVDTNSFVTSAIFNDLGQAISILAGDAWWFDGTNWSELSMVGLEGYEILSITDFNNRGDITGRARLIGSSDEFGFVSLAIPEPASGVCLCILGMCLLGFGGKKRQAD